MDSRLRHSSLMRFSLCMFLKMILKISSLVWTTISWTTETGRFFISSFLSTSHEFCYWQMRQAKYFSILNLEKFESSWASISFCITLIFSSKSFLLFHFRSRRQKQTKRPKPNYQSKSPVVIIIEIKKRSPSFCGTMSPEPTPVATLSIKQYERRYFSDNFLFPNSC